MKRYILTLITALTALASAKAMSYERAREEALYLTDKMAYELNLNDQQYNDAYEINLDYFLSMNTERDLYEDYLTYRLTDFRHILLNWQFDLMLRADYFMRPILWHRGCWVFPIYRHYHRDVFFYDRPHVFHVYRGGHGHGHYHHGFYADRRPRWDGGMRGREPMGGPGRGDGHRNPHRGDGYHFDLPSQGNHHPGKDEHPGRGGNALGNERGNRPSRNDNGSGYTRRGHSTDRTSGQTTPRSGYDRPGQSSYSRSESGTSTHSYDRGASSSNRGMSSGTRSGYGNPSSGRGNSFTRSSSRATGGSGSYTVPSRGGSVSRGSSAGPGQGRSGSPTTRGGAQGGGSVSRGRR
ncbi:MAG: hypothetical protein ACI3X4_03850 [Bacteroidaceae bacterium]